ncbi:MAG: hypothetical protein JWN76_1002 [Chitinophagaceae bacterium]|nr:hypothetical protein [Chitinophagaceae bacterium]
MIIVRKKYLILTILLFLIEVIIALFIHDQYIRPYVGDLLVVILIYCFIRSFFNVPVMGTALVTLVFAYTIEVLQYFKLVELLGLGDSKLARIIIGTSFQWIDMVAYTLGILVVILTERILSLRKIKKPGTK